MLKDRAEDGMGGKSSSSHNTRYVGVQVQQSVKGAAIHMGWGTFRATCNLIDYLDFKATAKSQAAGGKGGSGSTTNYSYSATVLMGLVSGPIAGVRAVYRDQSIFTNGSKTAIAKAGLNLATGQVGQPVWGYLSSRHGDHAIGYSGLAYVYAANYPLNSSATVPNHSFEVQSPVRQQVGATVLDDANPADIIADLLGAIPQWPAGALADLSDYRAYCLASGLLLSLYLDSQRQGADVLTEILTASNAEAVWSDGALRIVPYGDTAVSGNGATWSPDLSPAYDLTDDDFIASPGEDPVRRDVARGADAYNSVRVEFLDRAQRYAADVAPALDQASIDAFGLRVQDPVSLHCICDAGVAAHVAQLRVQRSCHVRRSYSFTLDERYGLLDPMDLVTLTSGRLNRTLVRLVQINEQSDGLLACTAEEMLVGAAHAAAYTRQAAAGYLADYEADPGAVSPPVLINPPAGYVAGAVSALAPGGGGVTVASSRFEAWAAVAGTSPDWGGCEVWASLDNLSYQKVGEIDVAARYGVSTSDFPVGVDPDAAHALGVDLSTSLGALDPATQAEADGGATVSLIGAEMIGWRDAALTGPNAYRLDGYIRRGMFGTAIADHPSGTPFVRVDAALFRYAYTSAQAGRTLYLKFPSFNLHGRALQGLDVATPYSLVLTPDTASRFVAVSATAIEGQGALATRDFVGPAQIAANAVTGAAASDVAPGITLAAGGDYVQLTSLSYPISGGRTKISALVQAANANAAPAGVTLSFRRGSGEIDSAPLMATPGVETLSTPFTTDPAPPVSGVAVYSLWAKLSPSSPATSCTITRARLVLEEFKR